MTMDNYGIRYADRNNVGAAIGRPYRRGRTIFIDCGRAMLAPTV